jgi:anti-sigma-K factor RskA
MSDIHALSGAYAVDALDDLERRAFERHLAHCDYCRGEVDSLREASVHFSFLTEVEPPAGLRERVLAEIDIVRPLPPVVEPAVVTDLTTHRSRRHPRRRVAALVAAAAAVAVIGVGTVATQPWQDSSSPVAEAPTTGSDLADAVLAAPDAEEVHHSFDDGGGAVLVRSRQLDRAVIVTNDMPDPPTGKVYELWFKAANGALVPAGVMPTGPDNTVVLSGDATIASGASAVGITVEPAPGKSTVPTSDPLVLPFKQA